MTVCVYLVGGMELILLVPYVLAQMFGGMIGAGLAKVRLISFVQYSCYNYADIVFILMVILI